MRTLLLLCITFFIPFNFSLAEEIKITTIDWEPYVGKNLPEKGFISDIISSAFNASEENTVTFFFVPWSKAIELAKLGNVDGYMPAYYNKKQEEDFVFSDPMPCGPLALLKLKDTEINYTGKVEELKPYKIGVVAGYTNTPEIDNSTELVKIEAKNDFTNLKNLISGTVDVAIADPLNAKAIMGNDKVLKTCLDRIETVKPYLDNKQLHVVFSKNAEERCKTFNEGLQKITENGKLEEILKKHDVYDVLK